MTENAKTLTFVGTAMALLLAAWLLRPGTPTYDAQSEVDTEFFPDFHDPLVVSALDVVEFDADSGNLKPFRVAKINGVFTIPSHQDYPADADRHLAEAATCVIGLTKLALISNSKSDHELYGVVEPSAELRADAAGVGKHVILEDKSGNKLVDLIVGKQDPDQNEIRYVRLPNSDAVYKTKLDASKLSTKFQNWIEDDLLKLNAFDIKQVVMDDHSVDALRRMILQRATTTVDYDNKEMAWKLQDMKVFNPKTQKWEPIALSADEELDSQKLNELKNALDDLKIVDVERKPAGLSSDLRAGDDFTKNREAVMDLQQSGFFVAQRSADSEAVEIVSNEGEVRCGTKDGVEYILRFGAIAGRSKDEEESEAKEKIEGDKPDKDKKGEDTDSKTEDDKNSSRGVDRYIMVTARFREDLIPKPDLQPLPEVKSDPANPAASAEPAKPRETPPANPAGATKPKEGAVRPAPGARTAPKQGSTKLSASDENLLALADDAQPPGAAKNETAPSDKQPQDAAAEGKDAADESVDPERKAIEKENKRKQDDYDKKVEAGKKKVQELNDRFADWYYVISDKTYQRIHIPRDELVKKKTKPTEQDAAPVPGADSLKNLLKQGR